MEQAVNKLRTEMEASKNPYVKQVGEHVLKVLEVNPAAAEKVLVNGKTIVGALQAIRTEAGKNTHDGISMLSDEEGYAVALKYFGFDETVPAPVTIAAPTSPVKSPTPATPPPAFGLSIDDLLGDL